MVVGPERLPKLVRVAGLWVGRANSSIRSIRNDISQELRAEELKQALNETIDLDPVASSTTPNTNEAETPLKSNKPENKDNDNG